MGQRTNQMENQKILCGKNQGTIYQNVGAAKAVCRDGVISLNAYNKEKYLKSITYTYS